MSYFGLDPEGAITRIRATSAPVRVASLSQSIASGGFGLAAVGLASFGVWIWGGQWLRGTVGDPGLYAACALVFILGGGAMLSPLVIGPDRLRRFYGLFTVSFFLYAGVWTGSYLSLRNRSGEWLGSLLGPAILGMTLANGFGAPGALRKAVASLVVAHALGYFGGELFYSALHGIAGSLLWGVTYGFGFGAGIGYAIFACQETVRNRLEEILRESSPPR